MLQSRSITSEELEAHTRKTKEAVRRLFGQFKQITPEELEAQLREQREKYKDAPTEKQPKAPTTPPTHDRPFVRGALHQPNQDGSIRRPLRQPAQNGSNHELLSPIQTGSNRVLQQKNKRFGAFYGRLKGGAR